MFSSGDKRPFDRNLALTDSSCLPISLDSIRGKQEQEAGLVGNTLSFQMCVAVVWGAVWTLAWLSSFCRSPLIRPSSHPEIVYLALQRWDQGQLTIWRDKKDLHPHWVSQSTVLGSSPDLRLDTLSLHFQRPIFLCQVPGPG